MADVIKLQGGDQITGKITQIKGGVLAIETAYAGTLSIVQTNVVSMTVDAPVNVREKPAEATPAEIPATEAKGSIDASTIRTLWLAGAVDPDIPPSPWNFSIAAEARYTDGNTDGVVAGLYGEANYLAKEWTLKLYGGANYDKSDGSVSEHKVFGGADVDYFLTDHSGIYAREELLTDRSNDIKIRSTFAAGYEYFLYKKAIPGDLEMLRLRLGLGQRYEKHRSDDSSNSSMTIDTGLRFHKRLNDTLTWTTEVTYAPAIDDFRDYLITHDSHCGVDLVKKWKLTHEIGIYNEYNSKPADGNEYLDTTCYARIKKTW